MESHRSDPSILKPLLAGGLMFALVGLLMDVRGVLPNQISTVNRDSCQDVVNADVVVSREQLAQLLTVPERDTKARVREILKEPFCRLPGLQIRAGVTAEREEYPLAFDPQTRLVILYEGDEYAGYRFSFH